MVNSYDIAGLLAFFGPREKDMVSVMACDDFLLIQNAIINEYFGVKNTLNLKPLLMVRNKKLLIEHLKRKNYEVEHQYAHNTEDFLRLSTRITLIR